MWYRLDRIIFMLLGGMVTLATVVLVLTLFSGCATDKPGPAASVEYPVTEMLDPVTEQVPNVR